MRRTLSPTHPFVLVAAVAGIGIAPSAAACDRGAVNPRFVEAAALCETADPDAAPRAAAVVAARETVSVTMTGYRQQQQQLARAVRQVERSHAPADSGLVAAIARRYRIDPRLLASVVSAESAGRAGAISNKGALGLMQVMPATARGLGVRDPRQMLSNPVLALSTGAVYLKQLQRQFGNNVPLVLAAYNAGPGAVMRAGKRVPRYRETQAYVTRIMGSYVTPRAAARR